MTRGISLGSTRSYVVVLLVVALAGAAVVLGVRAVSRSPQERYCETVLDRRPELSDILSAERGDVLLQALPVFDDLAARAPDDIVAQWRTVTSALRGLQGALRDAGVDAATYRREDPPTGLADAARDRIDAAATRVGAQSTSQALAELDQHARDVCGTPLTQ